MDLEFEWGRDTLGYAVTDAELQLPFAPFAPPDLFSPPTAFGPGAKVRFPDSLPPPPPWLSPEDEKLRIVRNGGRLVRYRVAQDNLDRIFEDFVNIKDADGARNFYNRWGPLGENGNIEGRGEKVWFLGLFISRMNQFIEAWSNPDKAKQEHFIERILGPDGFGVSDLEYCLVFDQQTRKPRRLLRIPNLFAALWVGLIDVLTNEEKVLRRCAHCNELFTAGGESGRRLDAKFCSDQHRVLYHRQKNAAASDPAPGEPRRRGRPRKAAAA